MENKSSTKSYVVRMDQGAEKSITNTRCNLRTKGVLSHDGNFLCLFCQLTDESYQHLLFTCEKINRIWMECYQWINMQTALAECAVTHHLKKEQLVHLET